MALQDVIRERSLRAVFTGLMPVELGEYKRRLPLCCCAAMAVFSILLGGGTRGGFLSDAILELLAIPAIIMSFASLLELRQREPALRRRANLALASCGAIMLVPLIQLVPLPPAIWTRLPGHREVAAVYDLLGSRPWLPLSVTPNETWLSFLSLLAPIAIFAAAVQMSFKDRRIVSLIIIALGVISVLLGLAQLAEGPTSSLRFFAFTNTTDAVGFFANRNHFAALLYTVLPFAAVWAIDIGGRAMPGSWRDPRSYELGSGAVLAGMIVVFICLLVGEALVHSRAGLIFTIIALTAVFLMVFIDRRQTLTAAISPSKLVVAAAVVTFFLLIQFALFQVMHRYSVDGLQDARITFARNTFAAAKAFFPFGSGLGSFVPVYQMFEKPADALSNTFANHAHDDFLEMMLETGLVGLALLGVFLVWLGSRTVKLWWHPPAELSRLDRSLARAATVVIVLLIAHSFVDYPLRTGAMMAVFAFSCALLVDPLVTESEVPAAPEGLSKPLRRPPEPLPIPAAAWSLPPQAPEARPVAETARKPASEAGGRWGEEIDWPDAWRK
jgi:O-antigen ligase